MLTALIITWLAAAPLYPLNPIEQDTLNNMNLHITAGLRGPSHISSAGPIFSVKYEYLLHHPFLLRTSFEYGFSRMQTLLYPKGDFHNTTYATDFIYYHGTNRYTGYLGIGIVLNKNYLQLDKEVADSLWQAEQITSVSMSLHLGYRLTFGMRMNKDFSIEVIITDVRPKLLMTSTFPNNEIGIQREEVRIQTVRLTFGYLIPLKK